MAQLYASVGIHHPKSSQDEAILLASMRRFEETQRSHKGLTVVTAVKDEKAGVLIGLSVWNSKQDFEAAWKEPSATEPKRRAAAGFRFEDHESEPHKFYSGEQPTA
jgi:hypothetical protein